MSQPVEDEIEVTRRVIDEELQVSVLPALEKHLNALDTLARGTPLMGLLGTILGMIKVFAAVASVSAAGVRCPTHFTGNHDDGPFQQPAGLQVVNECGDGLVDDEAICLVTFS